MTTSLRITKMETASHLREFMTKAQSADTYLSKRGQSSNTRSVLLLKTIRPVIYEKHFLEETINQLMMAK